MGAILLLAAAIALQGGGAAQASPPTIRGTIVDAKTQAPIADARDRALIADALDPGVLLVVDARRIGGRVVEQDLDAVRAGFLQPANRPLVEQVIGPVRQISRDRTFTVLAATRR